MYLTRKHFGYMLSVAFVLHLIVAVGYMLAPGLEVNKIPVHVLNIKLGSGELAALKEEVARAEATAKAEALKAAQQPDPVPPPFEHERLKAPEMPKQTQKAEEAPPKPKEAKKAETPKAAPQKKEQKAVKQKDHTPVGKVNTASRPSAVPKQYVRQMGDVAGVGQGNAVGNSVESEAEVIRRYEQLISIWIQRHKVYPQVAKSQGIQGRATIRIRIDRLGNIKLFRFEQRTGNAMLDQAVVNMVRAADPVPPVPSNYPSGNLIEFLIPVSYKLR